MKLPISWLREHLHFTLSVAQLADKLTALGLEVDSVDDPTARLAPFTVAEILTVEKHPEADRLSICRLATRSGEVQVVCGAPNVHIGMLGVFAPPGTTIPGTGLHLRRSKIRGVESAGMLCSERELEISDEHDGVIELPFGSKVGDAVVGILGPRDPVLDISLTPDRADCLSIRGIARDLAAAEAGTLRPLATAQVAGDFTSPIQVENHCEDSDACPVFVGRLIRGVHPAATSPGLAARAPARHRCTTDYGLGRYHQLLDA